MTSLRVSDVLPALTQLYPDARCSLCFSNPLELLIATILSAQCTDARVNVVTRRLFVTYRTPQEYADVALSTLEKDIYSCGAYRMKARAISESCRRIVDVFGGQVPQTMPEMLSLRGVGRKTASIVLGTAFGLVEGIPVDTHVTRLSKRLGLTQKTTQHAIELDLMRQTPRKDWLMLSHVLVAHGRRVCNARHPACERCIFRERCPGSTKARS